MAVATMPRSGEVPDATYVDEGCAHFSTCEWCPLAVDDCVEEDGGAQARILDTRLRIAEAAYDVAEQPPTAAASAAVLGVSRRTWYRLRNRGDIPVAMLPPAKPGSPRSRQAARAQLLDNHIPLVSPDPGGDAEQLDAAWRQLRFF